jgi:hypothetical protein
MNQIFASTPESDKHTPNGPDALRGTLATDPRIPLGRLAGPFLRRRMYGAAKAIERGELLPAGTLPERVEPAIDISVVTPWPAEPRAKARPVGRVERALRRVLPFLARRWV